MNKKFVFSAKSFSIKIMLGVAEIQRKGIINILNNHRERINILQ